ncbi:CASP-like protein 4D1 [Olea europaea var. sylvestris]|uniref:CASP-like protein 4D1 n=1 Tax=Olea europaea var. sylvestris TaxID=158386 RepID=UPI000C1CCD45|nr:CASP-like protein 4D1 [Olea europaea var. sylvestris]
MASQSVRNSVLVLRIFALLLLATSVALMVINNFTNSDGTKTKFSDLIAYSAAFLCTCRYVLATALAGVAYTLIQIPFAIYNVVNEKRLIRNGFLQEFDFYGDKIIAFLLATGVGVGFGVSCEIKRAIKQSGAVEDEETLKTNKFLDKGNISSGLLLGGFVCMAVLCILSSIRLSMTNRRFFR